MKKYLFLLLLLLLPSATHAISCFDNNSGSVADWGGFKSVNFRGNSFTVSTACNITSATIHSNYVLTSNIAWAMTVYSDSGGSPGSVLTTSASSSVTSTADPTWSDNTVTFDGTYTLQTATTYWMVAKNFDGTGGNLNWACKTGSDGKYFDGTNWNLQGCSFMFSVAGDAPAPPSTPTSIIGLVRSFFIF